MAPRLRVHARHVFMRKHDEHAQRFFGGSSVDRNDPAIRDRAVDECAMSDAVDRNVRGIACAAGHLEPTVDAWDRLSNNGHARAPAVCNARKATRCANSTLKAL